MEGVMKLTEIVNRLADVTATIDALGAASTFYKEMVDRYLAELHAAIDSLPG